MENHTLYDVGIGSAMYKIAIIHNTGAVFVYRDLEVFCTGQWFTSSNRLLLLNCPSESLSKIFEDKIREKLPEEKVGYL
jgi:hypothetical protein